MSRRTLRGTTALITGASSGIGEALAVELHARGVRLALAARREDRLNKLNDRLGGGHVVLVSDVSQSESCKRLIEETFERLGRLDTLVANAGYGTTKLTYEHTSDEVRRMFATNVFGTFDVIHHAVPRMLEQDHRDGYRGQLMLVSSAAARRGMPYFGPYCATKASQLSLAEGLRVELKNKGIAVTSVHPAGTKTEFGRVAKETGTVSAKSFAGRGGSQTAEQVAKAMAKAIERPTREVWPARRYRWLLGLNSMMPGIGDGIMGRLKAEVEESGD